MNEKELLKQKQRKWENDWHKKNYVQWNVKMTPVEKENLNNLIKKDNFISNRNFLQNSMDIINHFCSGENNLYLIVIKDLTITFDDSKNYVIENQKNHIIKTFREFNLAFNYLNSTNLIFQRVNDNSFIIEEICIEKIETSEDIDTNKLETLFQENLERFQTVIDYSYSLDDIKKIIINYDSLKRTISYFPRDIKTFVYKEIEED